MKTYVDRGGTFTDVVHISDHGDVEITKVRSDEAIVGQLAKGPLVFGTTVATNALLEHTGVRTLLITNRGLGDLPWIGDMSRPDLFDPDRTWPKPLCNGVLEVGGRLDRDGTELEPIEGKELNVDGYESVAIVLLHSHRNPAHEHAIKAQLEQLDAPPYIVMSHECSTEVGFLARLETTLVDAAITPHLSEALIRDQIPATAQAMQSDGSLCDATTLRAQDAVLSGPAGGVLAVARIAEQAGFSRAVGLDMGGTSTDVCRVDQGSLPRRKGDTRVAGVRLQRPMLEVETIAAGGGSILTNDGIRLRVGPASAGANPGPQCYGRGGPPTLTDAALAAGLVDPAQFDPPLNTTAVELPGEANEFLDIAREAMAQAVHRIATSRGIDLSDHALVAYGGAAGQHAAAVAERLGISTVLIHPCASVLSAWGLSLARPEHEAVLAIWKPLDQCFDSLQASCRTLEERLPPLDESEWIVDLRYQGTEHSIGVPFSTEQEQIQRVFEEEHTRHFGFARPSLAIEVVNVRVRVAAKAPNMNRVDDDPWNLQDRTVAGPHRISTPTTSIWVPDGWEASRQAGLLTLRPKASRPQPPPVERTPWAVELWGSRFMAVAEQAGEVLRRLARSVNVRERLDFSCAIFDGAGRLVANAPHIPVHLGAMGATVRDLLAPLPEPEPGQAYLCNDPAAGGSHLPDLTVVTPLVSENQRFFVASRAHHVDVGGTTPGSMPADSTQLADEGFVARHIPLLENERLRDLSSLLAASRQPDTVLADLAAQIAANRFAAQQLLELGPANLIATWMRHLQDVASESVERLIQELPEGSAQDSVDGVPLQLTVRREGSTLVADFSGTGDPHPGNLNAPQAVVRAALLYSLRTLIDKDIPLNEGTLRPVRIILPETSILSPPPKAAVAGGNVETSQRLVDLFLRATGLRAGSQGTMNNLTLGGIDTNGGAWSLYETIGGGTGATAHSNAPSGHQTHMTNTRATDIEVLETRYPLRVRRFAIRHGSGGAGRHSGGDGLVRELELVCSGEATLLATRRDQGACGIEGGASGTPGQDTVIREGAVTLWDGRSVQLVPGDRLRIETPGGGGYGKP